MRASAELEKVTKRANENEARWNAIVSRLMTDKRFLITYSGAGDGPLRETSARAPREVRDLFIGGDAATFLDTNRHVLAGAGALDFGSSRPVVSSN